MATGETEKTAGQIQIAVHLAIQDQKKQCCREEKKTHQNGNEPARKYNWTTAIEGLYYNAYTSLTTFVLFLSLYSLHFYLIKEHFSCGAESSFLFITFEKGQKKNVSIILTDCTIDRASSSLQQNGLPLTRTFVLKNKIKKHFIHQWKAAAHNQYLWKKKHLHIQSSDMDLCHETRK